MVWSEIKVGKDQALYGWNDLNSTIKRIDKGIKFSHRNDGAIFRNRENLLPIKTESYYREFVHPTPGIKGPGPQRIIYGECDEIYYTPDHYQSFIKVR